MLSIFVFLWFCVAVALLCCRCFARHFGVSMVLCCSGRFGIVYEFKRQRPLVRELYGIFRGCGCDGQHSCASGWKAGSRIAVLAHDNPHDNPLLCSAMTTTNKIHEGSRDLTYEGLRASDLEGDSTAQL